MACIDIHNYMACIKTSRFLVLLFLDIIVII